MNETDERIKNMVATGLPMTDEELGSVPASKYVTIVVWTVVTFIVIVSVYAMFTLK